MIRVLLVLALLAGCGAGHDCAERGPAPGGTARCSVGDEGRAYVVQLPDASGPLPVVLMIHGGGGNSHNAPALTAPDGDADNPDGMNAVAAEHGYILVYPDGTGKGLLSGLHTWNAGGGQGDWQCVSGNACKDGIDDVMYFNQVLDDLERWADVDTSRVYATGISNGGAMSYRLAHAMPDRLAAIAPVASADQYGIADGDTPTVPMPILHVHGTEDPCWPWEGGAEACAQKDGGVKAGVDPTLALWAQVNGCSDEAPVVESLPDQAEDGTTSTIETWQGCTADLVVWRITGGGHTWPDGEQYLKEKTVGRVERDANGNARILDFFDAHAH